VNWQRNKYFNEAVDFYGKKDYKDAMLSFDHSYAALAAINIPDTYHCSMRLLVLLWQMKKNQAKKYYIDLLKLKATTSTIYVSLSEIYRIEKDSGAALAVIREGQKMYPGNMPLFLAETNIYLTFNNVQKALTISRPLPKRTQPIQVFIMHSAPYNKIVDDTSKTLAIREQMFNLAGRCL